jgi:protein TonB
MTGCGEFAFAGAPGAVRLAPSQQDVRFWLAAFGIAILLHAGVLMALLDYRPPPTAQQEAMVVELAPLVQTTEQSQQVQPAPEPKMMAASPPGPPPVVLRELVPEPPPPPVVQPELVPEPPPVIESKTESVAPTPPAPKPRPKPPQPDPAQVIAPPEPVREPDFSAWSALQRIAPEPSHAAQRRVTAAPSEYLTRIHEQLERHKIYPRPARARGIEGLVQVAFVIDRRGNVVAHHIVRGSGYQMLDSAVDDMIKRAAPFPPFPAGMPGEELVVTMAVTFSLR